MHRDISAGNILIYIREVDGTAEVEGLLTDWELAKRTDDKSQEPRQLDRTVRKAYIVHSHHALSFACRERGNLPLCSR